MSRPIMMQREILQTHLNESEPENYLKRVVLAFKQQSLISTAFVIRVFVHLAQRGGQRRAERRRGKGQVRRQRLCQHTPRAASVTLTSA